MCNCPLQLRKKGADYGIKQYAGEEQLWDLFTTHEKDSKQHMHHQSVSLSLSTTRPLYTTTPSRLIVGLLNQTHHRVKSDHGGGQSVPFPVLLPMGCPPSGVRHTAVRHVL